MKIYAVIQSDWECSHVEALYLTREDAEKHVSFMPKSRHEPLPNIVEWEPWKAFDASRFTGKRYLRSEFQNAFSSWSDE